MAGFMDGKHRKVLWLRRRIDGGSAQPPTAFWEFVHDHPNADGRNQNVSRKDAKRFSCFLYRIRESRHGPDRADPESWRRLLLNCDLLVAADDAVRASVAGLLLFGKKRSIVAYASS